MRSGEMTLPSESAFDPPVRQRHFGGWDEPSIVKLRLKASKTGYGKHCHMWALTHPCTPDIRSTPGLRALLYLYFLARSLAQYYS